MGFLVALVIGVIVFWLVADAVYKPKKPKPLKPQPVTTDDVWATIRSAQKTVDDSYDLIYGRPRE